MMMTARRQSLTITTRLATPAANARVVENMSDTPQMNKKNGKILSVNVQPCQGACRSGA